MFPTLFNTSRTEPPSVLRRTLLILFGLLAAWLVFMIIHLITGRLLRPMYDGFPQDSEPNAAWCALRWNDTAASAGIVATLATLTLALAADFQAPETATTLSYSVGTAAGAMAIASGVSWFVGNRYTNRALQYRRQPPPSATTAPPSRARRARKTAAAPAG